MVNWRVSTETGVQSLDPAAFGYTLVRMKLNLPVFVGAAIVLAGLGVLILWKPELTPQEIAAPAVDHLRGELRAQGAVEGRDFVVDGPVFIRRTGEEAVIRLDVKSPPSRSDPRYFRLVPGGAAWKLDRDLDKDFAAFVEKEVKAACARLGKELSERFQAAVDIPPENVRIGSRVRETTPLSSTEPQLVGSIDIRYLDKGAEGRYVEDFTFMNGTWNMEGTRGQLFDRGPRPKE